MKSKKSIKPRAQIWGKNGILIGCAVFGTAVVMIVAGVGIGYAVGIRNNTPDVKPDNTPPTITHKVSSDQTAMFDAKNHVVHFVFTMHKVFAYRVKIELTIANNFASDLMKVTGDGVIQFCDDRGKPIWDREVYNTGSMGYFIEPGKTQVDVYIKQYKDNPFINPYAPQPIVEVPFALSFSYFPQGKYGPETSFDNADSSCSIFLLDNTPPVVTPDDITNLKIKFGDIFPAASTLSITDFTQYLSQPSVRDNLPQTEDSKENLSSYTDMYRVIQTLQKYDNAESICDMFIADFVLSILRTTGTSFVNRSAWEDLTLNFYELEKTTFSDASLSAYFKVYLYVSGCNEDKYKENNNVLFVASDMKFNSDSDTSLWGITWDYRLYRGDGTIRHDSVAKGLENPNYKGDRSIPTYREPGCIVDLRDIIKIIYDGVVNSWPAWW